jgi:DNA-binding MarR family transcriptional regulator
MQDFMTKKAKNKILKKAKTKDFNNEFLSIGIQSYKMNKKWEDCINSILSPFNLNHNQFYTLYYTNELFKMFSYPTQSMIGKEIGLEKMMISKIIVQLENLKMIEKRKHPTDTRANSINLTKKGFDVLQKTTKLNIEFEKDFFSNVTNLKKFIKNLNNLVND